MSDWRGAGTVRIDGARQLRSTLRRAGDKDMGDLKTAHKEAATIAAAAGRSRVPVRSGKLERTIRSTGTKTAGIIRAGFARVAYAGPIHWGWFKRRIKPTPFLSQGAQESEPRWLPLYFKHVEDTLDKIKGIS